MANQGIDINRVEAFGFTNIAAHVTGSNGEYQVRQNTIPGFDGVLFCDGVTVETAAPAAVSKALKDGVQRLNLRFRPFLSTTGDSITLRPFLRSTTTNERADLPLVVLEQAALNYTADVTTLSPTLLAAVTHFGFDFVGDGKVTGVNIRIGTIDGGGLSAFTQTDIPLFEFTAATLPGNLTVDTAVYYRTVEWDARTDYTRLLDVIQSDGSTPSAQITPTTTDAIATLTIPPTKNTAGGSETRIYVALYRFGDFPDGYGRLVALLPLSVLSLPASGTHIDEGADGAKGQSPYFAAPGNPFIAADYQAVTGGTQIVFTDNTPASFLLDAATYQGGREAPPKNIRDIIEFQGRLCLLAGAGRRSEFYTSWRLSADNNAGLYFTRYSDPTDPTTSDKGFYSHIGTEDGDKALRIIPLLDRVVVLFTRKAPWIITGTDPTNFELRPFAGETSTPLGLVARNAATLFDDAVCYLTPNGLVAWDTQSSPKLLSEIVRSLVSPRRARRTPFGDVATAQIAVWEHGGRLYLSLPTTSSDTVPNTVLCFAPEENGAWYRWTGINATGGTDLPGKANSFGHYITTSGGNLVLLTPNVGDKATAGATETAIAFSFQTRAYGKESGFEYVNKRPFRLDLDVTNTDATNALVLTITLSNTKGVRWSQTYSVPASTSDQPGLRPTAIRGELFDITVAGSTKQGMFLNSLCTQVATGSERI